MSSTSSLQGIDLLSALALSFQLAGRVLLIFLFIGFVFQGQFSIFRLLVSLVGLGACVMVAVGFKAKWSASFLVTGLSVANVFVNNWCVRDWLLRNWVLNYYANPSGGVCTHRTLLRTSSDSTFSRLFVSLLLKLHHRFVGSLSATLKPSLVVCCCSSTWVRVDCRWTRRKR